MANIELSTRSVQTNPLNRMGGAIRHRTTVTAENIRAVGQSIKDQPGQWTVRGITVAGVGALVACGEPRMDVDEHYATLTAIAQPAETFHTPTPYVTETPEIEVVPMETPTSLPNNLTGIFNDTPEAAARLGIDVEDIEFYAGDSAAWAALILPADNDREITIEEGFCLDAPAGVTEASFSNARAVFRGEKGPNLHRWDVTEIIGPNPTYELNAGEYTTVRSLPPAACR